MDRKRYLELCQVNAVFPKSAKVDCGGIQFYPQKLVIWFDKHGRVINSARMTAVVGNSVQECPIDEVEEIKT